jgi:hypothetical protein
MFHQDLVTCAFLPFVHVHGYYPAEDLASPLGFGCCHVLCVTLHRSLVLKSVSPECYLLFIISTANQQLHPINSRRCEFSSHLVENSTCLSSGEQQNRSAMTWGNLRHQQLVSTLLSLFHHQAMM